VGCVASDASLQKPRDRIAECAGIIKPRLDVTLWMPDQTASERIAGPF